MEFKDIVKQFADGTADEQDVIKAYEDATSNMVPRSRLNDKNEDIKELQAQLEERNNQIESLQLNVADESEYKKQLEELKKANDDWSNKYQQSQLNNAIKLGVAKDANDPNDILAFINKDELELADDGEVKGLEDAINNLKESKSYLFASNKPTGKTPLGGSDPTGGITKEQFNAMNYTDKVALYENDPSKYQELSQN
ncbi:phage scaffolding protein [Staphylococcus equorum]|uniref:phage scaffolding protein n=1 Tax=Staphylococcus equorum TaxID=246432 RepID=UPI00203F6ACF|nr:phage scaffolding protein [Staphylococcus equorum]MCM3071725.1 phage scaffolding protein [Staphylococcus equorum]